MLFDGTVDDSSNTMKPPATTTSTAEEDGRRSDDDSSTGSSEAGWGFLLGGLSTEAMASTEWTTTNDDRATVIVRSNRPDDGERRTIFETETTIGTVQEQKREQEQEQVSLRAFCLSPTNGRVLKPPVQILDRSCEQKGNILIATRNISKGQVVFTEKALEGIQVPSPQPPPSFEGTTTTTTAAPRNLYAVRSCQMCFRSLEPASCLSKESRLPFSELWPVLEYDDDPITGCHNNEEFIAMDASESISEPSSGVNDATASTTADVVNGTLDVHSNSGRVACRNCASIFCNRFCARNHLQAVGSCCRCRRAIEGLVRAHINQTTERLGVGPGLELGGPIEQENGNGNNNDNNDNNDNDNDSDETTTDGGGKPEDSNSDPDSCSGFAENIDPVLVLAAKMFVAHAHRYRKKQSDGGRSCSGRVVDVSDSPFRGLCGEAEDIPLLGLGSITPSPSPSSPEESDETETSSLPLRNEYEAIADAIELTESERRRSDSLFSLQQFQKIAAMAQRNAISLTTGSPFRTYYQAMIRKTGGRGSSRQQQVVSEVARILGSKDGKLTRDMDRMVEEKCVVKMGGIFTLTARMNHSCDPNAEIRGQEYVDCNIDVVAKKDICKGEEICISYVNLGPNPSNSISARNRRQRELRSRYLFHCQCSRCVR